MRNDLHPAAHAGPRRPRRAFLKQCAGALAAPALLRHPRPVAAASLSVAPASLPAGGARAAQDPEALVGSPRWPGSGFRASDFQNRFSHLGELIEISRTVPADVAGYVATWTAARDRALARAERFAKAGRKTSAADAYFQTATYTSRLYILYLRRADVPNAQTTYRAVREYFDLGVSLAGPWLPYERVTLPYEKTTLTGIFIPARSSSPGSSPSSSAGARRPVVYRTGGTDSTKEGSYMTMVWAPFVNRGVSCFVADAPGQGEALNIHNLTFPPDYERAVTAVVDYLSTRPDVDPKRIGLYGVSTGGYFGARGAAFEKRAAAVALQGACYDLLEDCYEYCPSFRRHLRYMIGAADDAQARRLLADYNFKGLGRLMTGPVSIVHGVKDDAVRIAGAERLFKEIASNEKQFEPVNAGHNLDVAIQDLVDWICTRLQA